MTHDARIAYFCGALSAAAYSGEHGAREAAAKLGFHRSRFIGQCPGAEVLVASDDDATIVAYRGTDPRSLVEHYRNTTTWWQPGPFGLRDRVHCGFGEWTALTWDAVRDAVLQARECDRAIYFTGHSRGGAQAVIAAATCKARLGIEPAGVYTFGAPRVGNREFAALFHYAVPNSFRYQNNNDVVPRVPPPFRYRHCGRHVFHFSRDGERWLKPHWWSVLWDRWAGRRRGLLAWGSDGLSDHVVRAYVTLLARHYAEEE
ncbi:MAG: lipase family protein [Planctomycetaceae bacterium]